MEIHFLAAEEISAWLPFASSPFFVEDYFGNRQLYPHTLPLKKEYRLLDQAIIRANIRRILFELAGEKRAQEALLTIGNYVTISNHGVTLEKDILHLVTDIREGVLIGLDGVEPSSTQFFKRVNDAEVFLCYALCLEGSDIAKERRPQRVTFTFGNGDKKVISFEPNTITWLQSEPNEEALLEFEFSGTTVNGKDHGSIPLVFGEAGLVIDARGRPFEKPDQALGGQAVMAKWLSSLNDIRFIK